MTARDILRCALAAVAALLLVVTPAAPAAAISEYHVASCATGAITEVGTTADPKGSAVVLIAGWTQPCEEVPPTTKFGFVHYYRTGAVLPLDGTLGTGLRGYGSPTAPASFSVTIPMSSAMNRFLSALYGPISAICLVRTADAPLACVSIDHVAGLPTLAVAPIPIDDARVQVPVLISIDSGGIHPPNQYCGNCI